MVRTSQATECEEVLDLADADDVVAGRRQVIQQRRLGRLQREVAAMRRAREVARRADERPRDYPANCVLAGEQPTRRLAHTIQLVEWDHFFVRRQLKDAVGGGVENRLAGAQMLGAELLDDRGAGRWLIAKCTATDRRFEPLDELGRKAVRIGWQRAVERDAHELPVPRRAVLPRRRLIQPAERPTRLRDGGRPRPGGG